MSIFYEQRSFMIQTPKQESTELYIVAICLYSESYHKQIQQSRQLKNLYLWISDIYDTVS